MSATLRRLILLAVIVMLASTTAFARSRAVSHPGDPSEAAKKWVFETNQLEYYLNDDGIAYIRPGLKIVIASITNVEAGKKPVLDVYFTDSFDQPLDRLGKVTPGAISPSFILAWWDPATRDYTSYTTRNATSPITGVTTAQAGTDSGGRWVDLETGHAQYTFGKTLPTALDTTKTHTLGVYATRNLTDILGKNYYFNLEQDFRPDAQTVTDKWDKIYDPASCNNCHNPLSAHGGSRQDVKLCALCHSPQTIDPDTGENLEMRRMIHNIHGSAVRANPYIVIGHNQSVADFSEVTYPQDIRNCHNCHEGTDATKVPAQASLWYTVPSRAACGTCHDTVNFETGQGHSAANLPQADDSLCATCHVPDSGEEFDASIKGAHTVPEKSAQLKGLNVEVDSFTNFAPGLKPTIAFKITENDGTAVDGSTLNSFSPMIAGPTSSYATYIRESGAARAVFDAATGTTMYTFNGMIPEDATGTWTISGDFYRNATLTRADGGADISLREAAFNPIKYVSLDGAAVTPRRTVVSMALCNNCHDRLALHGEQRLVIDECVICHNPVESDISRRPADAGAPESVSFQRMIHRIHTGNELRGDFTIYGFGGTPTNFNEVTFPGDRRDCAKCHVGSSYELPAAGDPVVAQRDYFTPLGSGTAACLGCHDSRDAAAHAYLNTAQFGGQPAESCGVCHGPNATWSVDKVHAR